jgi:peptide/nickel transport system substrate-binding protein
MNAAFPELTRRRFLQVLAGALATSACGLPGGTDRVGQPVGDGTTTVSGPIIVAVGGEPRTLVPSVGGLGGTGPEHLFEMIHQSLMTYDDQGNPVPRVAQALPSLDDGTWRVNADGTMETTWRLRHDVRWHDGQPFTSEDVIFSWRVFSDPAIPVTSRRVARLIDDIRAPDPHTVVMHWRSRYAFADQISVYDLTLLPRHLLAASFELRRERVTGHPFWRNEFIGLGPFRVARWPAGSSIELAAFDDYFLGPPRASGISVRFVPDDTSVMAAALAGSVDVVLPRRAVHGVVRSVRERWAADGQGVLSVLPGNSWVYLAPQFSGPHPEDLLDPRIRAALAHAVDTATIAEAVAGDRSMASDLWIPVADPRYRIIAEGTTRRDYSPERARELFREAGWRREASDDVLVKQGRRFEIELTTTSGWERAAALVAEYWREVGVAVREVVLALAAVTDRQNRAGFSGVELAAGVPNLALLDGRLHSANAPAPENQWVGANRGHYANRELDALFDQLWVSLERSEQEAAEREIAHLISSELPIVGLFFYPSMAMVRRDVRNSRVPRTAAPVGRLSMTWNAHEWEKA